MSQTRAARLGAEIFGRRGETMAAWYLRLKGYRIVETRVKTPVGEIDLVAQRFGVTVFVEVKARMSRASSAWRSKRSTAAASCAPPSTMWRATRHSPTTPLRFDVIFLAPATWPRHVKGAFDAS